MLLELTHPGVDEPGHILLELRLLVFVLVDFALQRAAGLDAASACRISARSAPMLLRRDGVRSNLLRQSLRSARVMFFLMIPGSMLTSVEAD